MRWCGACAVRIGDLVEKDLRHREWSGVCFASLMLACIGGLRAIDW
jgi:hypothetical protein